ncbi:MAG: tRNA pseudouridine(55) synthase TruB [Fulvivirga sp.]|nr:tRNA pseudouridine(55) synthase TruB [Fulvivirga sp.]
MNNPSTDPQEGRIILVDKPLHWTSFDVVKKLRYHFKFKKIGHAGTLDPLATGLLVLCTGKKTKEIEKYQGQEKEYTGTFLIGQTTPSYDLETEPTPPVDITHISKADLEDAAKYFTGTITQTPPIFSAVKVKGKRAYEHARKGEDVKLKSREVTIKIFKITAFNKPEVSFRVVCSKGTYIRSLAHDFGQKLGVGAYLASLRRTRIGNFNVADAATIETLTAKE